MIFKIKDIKFKYKKFYLYEGRSQIRAVAEKNAVSETILASLARTEG